MKTEQSEPVQNSFEAVMRHQRRGALLSDLSQTLQAAVMAVREQGAAAMVTLKLKIEPASDDADALKVSDEITSKLPQPRRVNTLFFATDEGCLVREDPNQKELTFTALPGAKVETESKAVNGQG